MALELLKSSVLQPVEKLPDALKESLCTNCWTFLSSCPDTDLLASAWDPEILPKYEDGRTYLTYTYSARLCDLETGTCILCKIFFYVVNGSPPPEQTTHAFEIAFFFRIGGGPLDLEEIKIYDPSTKVVKSRFDIERCGTIHVPTVKCFCLQTYSSAGEAPRFLAVVQRRVLMDI